MDIKVVMTKVRARIRSTGLRCSSDEVGAALTHIVERLVDDAIKVAQERGSKTVKGSHVDTAWDDMTL